MPHYVTENWIPESGSGIPRRDKAGGRFPAYVPDHLAHKAWTFSPQLTSRAARIEREILRLNRHTASGQLESVARLLMRSEAISSSRIEGIAPNVDKVVLAELAQEEEVRGFKESAEEVARNLTVLRSIEKSFATEPTISVELLERLQRELMGEKGSIPTGLRTIQNWIGGSNHTPIGAEFIPAPPRLVHDLVDADLLDLEAGPGAQLPRRRLIAHGPGPQQRDGQPRLVAVLARDQTVDLPPALGVRDQQLPVLRQVELRPRAVARRSAKRQDEKRDKDEDELTHAEPRLSCAHHAGPSP